MLNLAAVLLMGVFRPSNCVEVSEHCYMQKEVTVVDISPFAQPEKYPEEAREEVARVWGQAFESLGVARIEGHGVSDTLILDLRAEAAAFFKLPSTEKTKHAYGPYGTSLGGYTPAGLEAVAQSVEGVEAAPDPVESFSIRCEVNGTGMEPPASKGGWGALPFSSAEKYVQEMDRVLSAIHRMSAVALNLTSPDFFDSFYTRPNGNALRLAFYPPPTTAQAEKKFRYGEHTDYSGFTILLQDEHDHSNGAGGLEVQDPGSKQWFPVLPVTTTTSFVVNIGDLWKQWTNDKWTSTNHRVSSPSLGTKGAEHSRLSIVYFTGPRADAVISTLPGHGVSRHAPILAGDHLLEKLARTNV